MYYCSKIKYTLPVRSTPLAVHFDVQDISLGANHGLVAHTTNRDLIKT